MEHDLMTLSEGALLYGRSRTTFVWMCETGRVPTTRIGNRLFVKRADVEQLILNAAPGRMNRRVAPVREAA